MDFSKAATEHRIVQENATDISGGGQRGIKCDSTRKELKIQMFLLCQSLE